jgi:hypothetical protein
MKRQPALLALSREHHEALVLARRACEPQRPGAQPAALRLHLLQRWSEQFEPHFAAEEEVLLPALAAAGAVDEADAARSQHAQLRALVAQVRQDVPGALPRWGEAMREHVRWEERWLFPRAEALLDLAALGDRLARKEKEKEWECRR